MYKKQLVLLILQTILIGSVWAQVNQQGRTIPYFNAYNSPKSWDSYRSDVYVGGGAQFVNLNGDVPVDMSQGSGSLVFETSMPTGYWNVLFRIGWGMPVDYLRMGANALLHLHLKWDQIAPGADMDVQLITQENNIAGGFPEQRAALKLSNYVQPTFDWTDVYIPLKDFQKVNPKINLSRVPILMFMGRGNYPAVNKLFVEKMEIVPAIENPYTDVVKVNQIGYLPDQIKLAMVSFEKGASTVVPTSFNIVRASDDSIMFTGKLNRKYPFNVTDWGQDGDEVYQGYFTTFKTPGKYKMVVPELNQTSLVFSIADTAYNPIFRDALRFFLYSRSGEAIAEPFAEGHTRPALFAGGSAATYDDRPGTRDVKGGWFDAGDTHLDAHAPYEAVWWLLETLRQFEGKVQKKSLNIPESEAGANDLCELIKYELMWYEKLWNPDGSVHFFVTQRLGNPIPSVSDVTSSSAAVLAALFAKAYPLYKKYAFYSEYADTLLVKAEKSWEWLQKNPQNVNPIEPSTGTWYGYAKDDAHDQGMRAIAAISLYNATGKAEYHRWFTSRFNDPLTDYFPNQAWGGILSGLEQAEINLGYMDYIQSPQPDADQTIITKLKSAFIKEANWTIERIGYTSYNIPLAAPNHLFWGSSGLIATHAYVYDQVYKWSGNLKYKNAIYNCVDWILGRNPVNSIFVTGYGDTIHGVDIYSFFWDDNFNAPPGYLCGNIMAYDDATAPVIKDPWKRFMNVLSAPTLEPGIYWNAELAWLMGFMAQNAGAKRDCNGDADGTAFWDQCGECVGGNTGKQACIPDVSEPLKKENQLKIFPNPSGGIFWLQGDFDGEWQVMNSAGSTVLKGRGQTIDLSNYSGGLFFLKAGNNNYKLIKH